MCVTNDCVEAARPGFEPAAEGMGLRDDVKLTGAAVDDDAGTEPGLDEPTPAGSDGLAMLGRGGADEQAPAVDDDVDVTVAGCGDGCGVAGCEPCCDFDALLRDGGRLL